ncbi:carboxypeptidase N subunit 2-like [Uloborus diversus]|uniref:carboxypeptidase N subunit 2-like n=1 Tax=Uloborus diversus TaxID=327109 RepID=UPI0024098274|nr:carboxypeptidase N subunit 2-like [Uloborus diversus]
MIFLVLFSVLLGVWNCRSQMILNDMSWINTCPSECECQYSQSSQMFLSKWKTENNDEHLIKSAVCVFNNHNIKFTYRLSDDIESITFLQENDTQTIFTNDILKHFQKVQSIDLQGSLNSATVHITNSAFHNLEHLKFLALQRVDMTGAQKAFAKLSELEVLYVIHCTIGYLKWEMLDGLLKLKELYLLQSGIKELYGFAFYGTPELRRLFLSHNDLLSVDADAFVGLLKLEYLDLSNNQIDHLSGLTFPPLPHLQWLELKHNPIKVIFPHCFQFLNGTQHLTLGHKQQPVHLMKFSFRGLYSLKFLHIPNIDNDILIEHMFYDLRALMHLNLQGRIKIINNRAFNGAHKLLKKLILHNCQLQKLYKDSFHGLEVLQVLDLSLNHLQSLEEETFRHLKSIRYILLHNNKLKQMPSELFFENHQLQAISLHGNPWNCSCNMKEWKENIVMSNYIEPIAENCTNQYNCTEEMVPITDINTSPVCENPVIYKGEELFTVLKSLNCP